MPLGRFGRSRLGRREAGGFDALGEDEPAKPEAPPPSAAPPASGKAASPGRGPGTPPATPKLAGHKIEGFGSAGARPAAGRGLFSPGRADVGWALRQLLGDWGMYDNQLPKAALLHLVNACGQDSPDPRGAARDLCAAVRKELDRRSSGALVDPNDCGRICKAAVSVHRAVLHRGNVAARRQLVAGHPDLFRLPQAAQPKSVACGAGWRAELAVAYCAYLHRYTRLLREHADLDNLQGVELYGEASAEYAAAAAAWGEVAVAARGAQSNGGDGRAAYLAQALRKLKAVQLNLHAALECAVPQAASKRKLAYSPRTNSSYFTLPAARAAQLEVLQDAVTLLLHAQDLVARIEAVCGADGGGGGAHRASPRFAFEALKALPDVKAVRRQQVAQLLAWEEAVDGAKDADPLTRSRLRTLRKAHDRELAAAAPAPVALFGAPRAKPPPPPPQPMEVDAAPQPAPAPAFDPFGDQAGAAAATAFSIPGEGVSSVGDFEAEAAAGGGDAEEGFADAAFGPPAKVPKTEAAPFAAFPATASPRPAAADDNFFGAFVAPPAAPPAPGANPFAGPGDFAATWPPTAAKAPKVAPAFSELNPFAFL